MFLYVNYIFLTDDDDDNNKGDLRFFSLSASIQMALKRTALPVLCCICGVTKG